MCTDVTREGSRSTSAFAPRGPSVRASSQSVSPPTPWAGPTQRGDVAGRRTLGRAPGGGDHAATAAPTGGAVIHFAAREDTGRGLAGYGPYSNLAAGPGRWRQAAVHPRLPLRVASMETNSPRTYSC